MFNLFRKTYQAKEIESSEEIRVEYTRLRMCLRDDKQLRKELAEDVCKWLQEEMDPHFLGTERITIVFGPRPTRTMETELTLK
jgi:hypothetical protein